MEDVNHEIDVIQEHPARVLESLDVPRPDLAIASQALLDPFGDGSHLDVALSARQHEPVGGRGQVSKIEQHDLASLVVDGLATGEHGELTRSFRRGPGTRRRPRALRTGQTVPRVTTMWTWTVTSGCRRIGTSYSPSRLIGGSSLICVRWIRKPFASSPSAMSAD